MQFPKITIITVTYNSEKFLLDCIKSVQIQNYSEIEHIIIDGCSSDRTVDIIKANEHSIAKWISEKDKGMYDAINKGIALGSGEIIGILNSDDVLASPDVISNIAKAFMEQNIDSLYGDIVYVDTLNLNKVLRTWKGSPYKRVKFNYGWMPAHPTFYIRANLIKKYGGYEQSFSSAADYEFMSRYLYKYHVNSFYLPMLIVKMRIGGQSNESILGRIRANRRDYLAMKKNEIHFPVLVSVLKPLRKIPQFYNSLLNYFM